MLRFLIIIISANQPQWIVVLNRNGSIELCFIFNEAGLFKKIKKYTNKKVFNLKNSL